MMNKLGPFKPGAHVEYVGDPNYRNLWSAPSADFRGQGPMAQLCVGDLCVIIEYHVSEAPDLQAKVLRGADGVIGWVYMRIDDWKKAKSVSPKP